MVITFYFFLKLYVNEIILFRNQLVIFIAYISISEVDFESKYQWMDHDEYYNNYSDILHTGKNATFVNKY